MTPALLLRAQTLLYGEQGGVAMAEALGVTYRTYQRWRAGQNPMPEGLGHEIAAVLRGRADDALSLAEECAAAAVEAS